MGGWKPWFRVISGNRDEKIKRGERISFLLPSWNSLLIILILLDSLQLAEMKRLISASSTLEAPLVLLNSWCSTRKRKYICIYLPSPLISARNYKTAPVLCSFTLKCKSNLKLSFLWHRRSWRGEGPFTRKYTAHTLQMYLTPLVMWIRYLLFPLMSCLPSFHNNKENPLFW